MARSKSLVVFVFFLMVASIIVIYTMRLFSMQVVHGES